ncbi:hypothetical protein PAEPH01_2652, partial [Pancytospora epiphaga]
MQRTIYSFTNNNYNRGCARNRKHFKNSNAVNRQHNDDAVNRLDEDNAVNRQNDTKKYNSEVETLTEETLRKEFPEVTEFDINTKGYTGEKCEINTHKGKMVQARYRPVKTSLSAAMEETIQNLLAKDYIRESSSVWNNMIRPVPKPDGSIRLCMNMMALNDITEEEIQRIPNMQEIFSALQGAEWLTMINLKNGYFQIHLDEKDKHKTAFIVNGKKYKWNRMPMGFKNTPMNFQRIMNRKLKEWINKTCNVYMDDIVVYGKTSEEHDAAGRNILAKSREVGLKINMKKKEVNLLGMIASGKGVMMPGDKKDKILNYGLPKTKKDIQKFLEAVNFHRRFIINMSKKTALLTEILKNDKSMEDWTEEHTRKWKELKEEVNQNTLRYHPDYSKKFVLETDALNTGVGAILYQLSEKGEKEVIRPISVKL